MWAEFSTMEGCDVLSPRWMKAGVLVFVLVSLT